jgi:glycolate dehydrogenase FAD-binding subunit
LADQRTTPPLWLSSLEALVGAHRCEAQAARLWEYVVDGLIPSAIVWPETIEHVAAILQWAQGEKLGVMPRGSATQIGLGNIPQRLDVVLSTRHLAHVGEYDTANFTLTAGAGMTFAQLAQLTAAQTQMLPLQRAFSIATLGGLIAANSYSPKRLRYGGVGDFLLGLRVALPGGQIVHFGGKVVKNVAGYDMGKLFLGSLGTLGVIVEATFKLLALPEREATLLAVFPSLQMGTAAVTQLMATQLLPSQILLLNTGAAHAVAPEIDPSVSGGAILLLVSCEGMAEAVERHLTDMAELCQRQGAVSVQAVSGAAQLELQARVDGAMHGGERKASAPTTRLPPLASGRMAAEGLVIRLGTLPSRVYTVMQAAAQVLKPLTTRAMIFGDCGVGMVKLCLGPEELPTGALDAARLDALRGLSDVVVAQGGYGLVERAPLAAKMALEVWGPPPSSFALLRALKCKFDPEAILNPGRFIGGL